MRRGLKMRTHENSMGFIRNFYCNSHRRNSHQYCYRKVSRQDFLQDLARFATKQKIALENSTQFYYAAPYGLLKPDEMPEGCGLLEVQNGRTVTTKAAPLRPLEALNSRFVAAILRAALVTREVESKHAWRYMG